MLEVLFSLVMAFGISYVAMPIVIRMAIQLDLVDRPEARRAHLTPVPLFGGVGIFLSIALVLLLWTPDIYFDELRYVLCALVIMFLVGAKDDIDPISPMSKLIGQLTTVMIIILLADIRISEFYGFLGVHSIPDWVSVLVSILFYILVINAFNLIDGINGLASSITIVACTFFGVWFYLAGEYAFCLFATIVVGATLAFLRFNLTPARIFMGDTGSLVLGTSCAVLAVQFMEAHASSSEISLVFDQVPAVAFAVLIVPLFDTLRVFVVRLRHGVSPFIPDDNHIHHLLLRLGMSHGQATMLLVGITLTFLTLAILLQGVHSSLLMISMVGCCWLLTLALEAAIVSRGRELVRSQN